MKEGLPSIMGLKADPFIKCPTRLMDGGYCNVYKLDPCPDCPIPNGQHEDFIVSTKQSEKEVK